MIQDEEGSRLVGIDPQVMMRLILVLSGVLAGVVAITRSMVAPVNVRAGFSLTVLGLIVTVVGGLGSISGAFLAGLVLGIINSVASSYIGTFLSLIILLVAAADDRDPSGRVVGVGSERPSAGRRYCSSRPRRTSRSLPLLFGSIAAVGRSRPCRQVGSSRCSWVAVLACFRLLRHRPT